MICPRTLRDDRDMYMYAQRLKHKTTDVRLVNRVELAVVSRVLLDISHLRKKWRPPDTLD